MCYGGSSEGSVYWYLSVSIACIPTDLPHKRQVDYFCTQMKKIRNIPLLFIAVVLISACKRKAKPLTNEEVIAVINKFDEAWRNKNLQVVDSVLGNSYEYFTQSGGVFSRDSVVQTAGSPTYSLDKVERTEIEIKLYEDMAIASTRWKGKGTYRGVPFDEDQRCSITIGKHDNKVEILSEHCTPIRSNKIFH